MIYSSIVQWSPCALSTVLTVGSRCMHVQSTTDECTLTMCDICACIAWLFCACLEQFYPVQLTL